MTAIGLPQMIVVGTGISFVATFVGCYASNQVNFQNGPMRHMPPFFSSTALRGFSKSNQADDTGAFEWQTAANGTKKKPVKKRYSFAMSDSSDDDQAAAAVPVPKKPVVAAAPHPSATSATSVPPPTSVATTTLSSRTHSRTSSAATSENRASRSNPHFDRLKQFYLTHDARKADDRTVTKMLSQFQGREEDMFSALEQKYAVKKNVKATPASSATSSTKRSGRATTAASGSGTDYRSRLVRFLEKYNREKLPATDKILKHYEGNEDSFFDALVKRYGPEPTWPPSSGDDDSSDVEGGHGLLRDLQLQKSQAETQRNQAQRMLDDEFKDRQPQTDAEFDRFLVLSGAVDEQKLRISKIQEDIAQLQSNPKKASSSSSRLVPSTRSAPSSRSVSAQAKEGSPLVPQTRTSRGKETVKQTATRLDQEISDSAASSVALSRTESLSTISASGGRIKAHARERSPTTQELAKIASYELARRSTGLSRSSSQQGTPLNGNVDTPCVVVMRHAAAESMSATASPSRATDGRGPGSPTAAQGDPQLLPSAQHEIHQQAEEIVASIKRCGGAHRDPTDILIVTSPFERCVQTAMLLRSSPAFASAIRGRGSTSSIDIVVDPTLCSVFNASTLQSSTQPPLSVSADRNRIPVANLEHDVGVLATQISTSTDAQLRQLVNAPPPSPRWGESSKQGLSRLSTSFRWHARRTHQIATASQDSDIGKAHTAAMHSMSPLMKSKATTRILITHRDGVNAALRASYGADRTAASVPTGKEKGVTHLGFCVFNPMEDPARQISAMVYYSDTAANGGDTSTPEPWATVEQRGISAATTVIEEQSTVSFRGQMAVVSQSPKPPPATLMAETSPESKSLPPIIVPEHSESTPSAPIPWNSDPPAPPSPVSYQEPALAAVLPPRSSPIKPSSARNRSSGSQRRGVTTTTSGINVSRSNSSRTTSRGSSAHSNRNVQGQQQPKLPPGAIPLTDPTHSKYHTDADTGEVLLNGRPVSHFETRWDPNYSGDHNPMLRRSGDDGEEDIIVPARPPMNFDFSPRADITDVENTLPQGYLVGVKGKKIKHNTAMSEEERQAARERLLKPKYEPRSKFVHGQQSNPEPSKKVLTFDEATGEDGDDTGSPNDVVGHSTQTGMGGSPAGYNYSNSSKITRSSQKRPSSSELRQSKHSTSDSGSPTGYINFINPESPVDGQDEQQQSQAAGHNLKPKQIRASSASARFTTAGANQRYTAGGGSVPRNNHREPQNQQFQLNYAGGGIGGSSTTQQPYQYQKEETAVAGVGASGDGGGELPFPPRFKIISKTTTVVEEDQLQGSNSNPYLMPLQSYGRVPDSDLVRSPRQIDFGFGVGGPGGSGSAATGASGGLISAAGLGHGGHHPGGVHHHPGAHPHNTSMTLVGSHNTTVVANHHADLVQYSNEINHQHGNNIVPLPLGNNGSAGINWNGSGQRSSRNVSIDRAGAEDDNLVRKVKKKKREAGGTSPPQPPPLALLGGPHTSRSNSLLNIPDAARSSRSTSARNTNNNIPTAMKPPQHSSRSHSTNSNSNMMDGMRMKNNALIRQQKSGSLYYVRLYSCLFSTLYDAYDLKQQHLMDNFFYNATTNKFEVRGGNKFRSGSKKSIKSNNTGGTDNSNKLTILGIGNNVTGGGGGDNASADDTNRKRSSSNSSKLLSKAQRTVNPYYQTYSLDYKTLIISILETGVSENNNTQNHQDENFLKKLNNIYFPPDGELRLLVEVESNHQDLKAKKPKKKKKKSNKSKNISNAKFVDLYLPQTVRQKHLRQPQQQQKQWAAAEAIDRDFLRIEGFSSKNSSRAHHHRENDGEEEEVNDDDSDDDEGDDSDEEEDMTYYFHDFDFNHQLDLLHHPEHRLHYNYNQQQQKQNTDKRQQQLPPPAVYYRTIRLPPHTSAYQLNEYIADVASQLNNHNTHHSNKNTNNSNSKNTNTNGNSHSLVDEANHNHNIFYFTLIWVSPAELQEEQRRKDIMLEALETFSSLYVMHTTFVRQYVVEALSTDADTFGPGAGAIIKNKQQQQQQRHQHNSNSMTKYNSPASFNSNLQQQQQDEEEDLPNIVQQKNKSNLLLLTPARVRGEAEAEGEENEGLEEEEEDSGEEEILGVTAGGRAVTDHRRGGALAFNLDTISSNIKKGSGPSSAVKAKHRTRSLLSDKEMDFLYAFDGDGGGDFLGSSGSGNAKVSSTTYVTTTATAPSSARGLASSLNVSSTSPGLSRLKYGNTSRGGGFSNNNLLALLPPPHNNKIGGNGTSSNSSGATGTDTSSKNLNNLVQSYSPTRGRPQISLLQKKTTISPTRQQHQQQQHEDPLLLGATSSSSRTTSSAVAGPHKVPMLHLPTAASTGTATASSARLATNPTPPLSSTSLYNNVAMERSQQKAESLYAASTSTLYAPPPLPLIPSTARATTTTTSTSSASATPLQKPHQNGMDSGDRRSLRGYRRSASSGSVAAAGGVPYSVPRLAEAPKSADTSAITSSAPTSTTNSTNTSGHHHSSYVHHAGLNSTINNSSILRGSSSSNNNTTILLHETYSSSGAGEGGTGGTASKSATTTALSPTRLVGTPSAKYKDHTIPSPHKGLPDTKVTYSVISTGGTPASKQAAPSETTISYTTAGPHNTTAASTTADSNTYTPRGDANTTQKYIYSSTVTPPSSSFTTQPTSSTAAGIEMAMGNGSASVSTSGVSPSTGDRKSRSPAYSTYSSTTTPPSSKQKAPEQILKGSGAGSFFPSPPSTASVSPSQQGGSLEPHHAVPVARRASPRSLLDGGGAEYTSAVAAPKLVEGTTSKYTIDVDRSLDAAAAAGSSRSVEGNAASSSSPYMQQRDSLGSGRSSGNEWTLSVKNQPLQLERRTWL